MAADSLAHPNNAAAALLAGRVAVVIAAAVFAGAFAPAVAAAQDDEPQPALRAYVLAVPMSQELEPISARVGAAARATLRELSAVESAPADQAFLGYSDFTVERLERARQRLEEGRDAYLNLELDRAIELLSGAVEDFDAAAAALEDPQDLGDALLFLGASQVFQGDSRSARRTFARLHVQMPYLEPDPNLFNPNIIQEYERSRPRRSARGAISVESDPSGAIAYIDYVARGRTPLTEDGLADGSHVVRVTRPGATPFVQEAELRRGRGEEVNAFLEDNEATPGLAEALVEMRDHSLESMSEGDPISRIANALGVERLGIIQVSEGDDENHVKLRFIMFDVTTGEHGPVLVGPVPRAFGDLEEGVRTLVGQGLEVSLADTAAATDSEDIPARRTNGTDFTQPPPEQQTPVYEKWWFWTIIGAVVVAGAAVAIGVAAANGGGQSLGENPGGQVILVF